MSNNNTFHALAEAKSSLRMAETALVNARRMDGSQLGMAFVEKRIREAEASIQRWTATIEELETAGVTNTTPVTEQSTEISEKAKRKAAKKAAKRQNLLKGTTQRLPSRATGNRRKFNQPRLTPAQMREQQMARELERFESFKLKEQLQRKLAGMPSNQGLHIGGILHVGQASPRGNSESFSYTKRETAADGESKVYEYIRENAGDGYFRERKYHNGVEVSSSTRRSPFGKLPNARQDFTPTEDDFPVLEHAHVIPQSPEKRKYRSWAAAAVQDTGPVVPTAPSTPRNQGTTPVPPNAPERPQAAPRTAVDDGFTAVANKKRSPRKPKITLTPAMAARVEKMPANVGMFVKNKIFWGKQPKTPHNTKMATKLTTVNGKRGVLRYTWNSRVYREHFKAQNTTEWVEMVNRRENGERIMCSAC